MNANVKTILIAALLGFATAAAAQDNCGEREHTMLSSWNVAVPDTGKGVLFDSAQRNAQVLPNSVVALKFTVPQAPADKMNDFVVIKVDGDVPIEAVTISQKFCDDKGINGIVGVKPTDEMVLSFGPNVNDMQMLERGETYYLNIATGYGRAGALRVTYAHPYQ
jgi:hypothetical protein